MIEGARALLTSGRVVECDIVVEGDTNRPGKGERAKEALVQVRHIESRSVLIVRWVLVVSILTNPSECPSFIV